MLQTPVAGRFAVEYEGKSQEIRDKTEADDPWNHWVFEIYAGSIELESNENTFHQRMYLIPVPQNVIDRNPAIVQNP
jgi:hypothetical protein